MSVVWIILESGTVLSVGTVFLLAFYTTKKDAGAVVIGINGQTAVRTMTLCCRELF